MWLINGITATLITVKDTILSCTHLRSAFIYCLDLNPEEMTNHIWVWSWGICQVHWTILFHHLSTSVITHQLCSLESLQLWKVNVSTVSFQKWFSLQLTHERSWDCLILSFACSRTVHWNSNMGEIKELSAERNYWHLKKLEFYKSPTNAFGKG